MESRRVDLGDITVALLEAGSPGERPLLLVHGFTGAKEDFADHLDALAATGRHVVAPDLRGHGSSGHPAGEDAYSVEIFAADQLALADALGWNGFDLVGHSMGGTIAQTLVLKSPEKVGRLVLMDTWPGPVQGIDVDLIELAIQVAREHGVGLIADILTEADSPLTSPAGRRLLDERPGYREMGDRNLRGCSPEMYAAMATLMYTQDDRLDRLRELDMPTLVVVGEQDTPALAASRAMADVIPGASLVVLDDAGHSPQFESPDAWFAVLTSFLGRGVTDERATPGSPAAEGHGGQLAVAAMAPFGVRELFTLSGGHVFPIYDGAVKGDGDLRLIDVRHEQTATFAAEGMAKLTRRPGVAVLTAGPGVTNGISAVTTAMFNGSPLVVLGGRAPQARWGAGSLQEFDHVPVLAPVTKSASTITSPDDIVGDVQAAARRAWSPHRGPVFLDLPLDVVFGHGQGSPVDQPAPRGPDPDPDEVAEAAALIAGAERPALIAGSDVYWDGAWSALQAAVEHLRVPTFVNGLGRGCLPADHELAFSRTRGRLKTDADVVVVVGTPLDFRLSFGSFGDASVVHIVDTPEQRAGHVAPAASPAGDLGTILTALADWTGDRRSHEAWIAELRDLETAAAAADEPLLAAADEPIKPTRVYGEMRRVLDRDAIVVNDGGDFVSYAGKYIDSYEPGRWLDPGPYGCLGTGLGYAIAARVAHPDRQVVVMMGDGAAGFSLMDVDTLVRHQLPVVIVVGNNGIWGLEKHPMQMLYGYDVAADLQAGCRYDDVMRALGGAGEVVDRPDDIAPALARAFASGVPYLVNILTDPADAYPRSSNLA